MADTSNESEAFFREAEILRDDFLEENEGKQGDALLAACQILLRYARENEQLRRLSSVGFIKKGRRSD